MKLKNVLFIAIAILTIGLFVACNDEVVATTDNNVAYTQVLESNGAFEYNGTKYETLQLALKAIVDGKGTPAVKTIKVLRDVTGPVAAIGKNQSIVLDLNGNALTFIDVTDSALLVGNGTTFTVKNGSMSLFDTSNADLAVVKADGAESITLEGVNINTAGQYALVADGTTTTTIDVKGGSVLTGNAVISNATLSIADSSKLDGALDADDSHVSLGTDDSDTSIITGEINIKGSDNGKTTFTTKQFTKVTGKVTATGQHTASETVKDVALDIKNTIDSLTLENSYINIPSPGHVTVDDMGSSGNYYVAEEGYSAVTLPAGSDVVVNSGQCVVVTESMVSYYGSISEALADNKYAGATIKLLKEDTQDIDENLSIGYSVDINLNGYCLNTTNESSITLADGVTLKVFNNNGSNVTEATFKAAVTSDSNGTSNFVVGKSDDTAKIKVTGTVNVTGSFTAAKAILDSAVSAGGALTSGYGAEFKSTVSAASVTDGVVPSDNVTEVAGSTFEDSVTATGALVSYKSTFTASASEKTISGSTLSFTTATFTDQSNVYALEATGADPDANTSALKITTSTGKVASLTASAGSIDVENSSATTTLTVTGNILSGVTTTPAYYDVTLVGKSGANVVVNGTIDGNDISLTYATVNGNVTAKDVADDTTTTAVDETDNGSITATNSTFTPSTGSNKELKGNTISVSNSTFNATDSYYYALEANGADPDANTSALKITTSTGKVASLTASAGSINVANGSAAAALTVTGDVIASNGASSGATYYDVTLVGKSGTNVVVNGNIYGDDFNANYVTFKAPAGYNKEVGSKTATISNSNFDASNSSYYYFNASGYYEEGTYEDYAILVLNTSGTLNSLTATAGHIGIDNYHEATVTSSLTILDDVSATDGDYYYNVVLAGNNSALVFVRGDIYGDSVSFEYKTESDGDVIANTSFSAKYSIVGDSTVHDTVFSPAIEISNSQINLNRLAGGATESAKTVIITSPLAESAITTLDAETLSVTDANNYLTVTNAYITGISTKSLIAGGTYNALSFTGNAISELEITKGVFTTTGDNNYQFLNGRTRVRGTYADTSAKGVSDSTNYSVQMVGIDRMDADFVVECAHITSADLTNVSNIVAKINQSLSSQYIYIDYQPDTIVAISSAPEYKFSTTGYIYTGHVTLNFGYTPTSGYTLTTALIVTGNSAPYFNFGNNYVTVTGRVFVTYEASLYSTLNQSNFVTLATNSTSVPVWIVSLPGELDGGRYKYKAASMTLSASQLVVAKNRILVDTSTVGENVGTGSDSYVQCYYDGNYSHTVYSAKGTSYIVATLPNSSMSEGSYATANTIQGWGRDVIGYFWNQAGMATSNTIWAGIGNPVDCYTSSGWTTGDNSSANGHHFETVSHSF